MKPIFAKKSLGQNFLKSQKALRAMALAGDVRAGDVVIEIGPGTGLLTKVLLEKGATVIAFEKDHRLIELLQTEFAKYISKEKFFLYEKDILEVDLCHPEFISGPRDSLGKTPKQVRGDKFEYKLIANIPYYITGEIVRKFLTTKHKPTYMVLLVQKEVANRIVDVKESILSLSVKVFGTPKKIMTVKKESFTPEPKVDSAIIQITHIHNPFANLEAEQKFFTIIKKAFGQKRKKLNTTLKEYKDQITDWEKIKDKRPENLNVEEWKKIAGV